jgi:hypothetical protein
VTRIVMTHVVDDTADSMRESTSLAPLVTQYEYDERTIIPRQPSWTSELLSLLQNQDYTRLECYAPVDNIRSLFSKTTTTLPYSKLYDFFTIENEKVIVAEDKFTINCIPTLAGTFNHTMGKTVTGGHKPFHVFVMACIRPLSGQFGDCFHITWSDIDTHNRDYGRIIQSKLKPKSHMDDFVLKDGLFFNCFDKSIKSFQNVMLAAKFFKITKSSNEHLTTTGDIRSGKINIFPYTHQDLIDWFPNSKEDRAAPRVFITGLVIHGVKRAKPKNLGHSIGGEAIETREMSLIIDPFVLLEVEI